MRRLRSESGQATVLFALAAVTILSVASLSLDAGRAYVKTQQLKAAADAAALAGGQDLPQDPASATSVAVATAVQNGVPSQDVQVTLNQQDNVITVTTTGGIPYYFASLFGMDQGTFHETSAVQVGPISEVTGAVPLGVVWNSFSYGQTYTLKDGGSSGSDGNYGALALSVPGADSYQTYLTSGYPAMLQVGQDVATEPGDMQGPTESGLSARVAAGSGYSWQTVPLSSPAVVDVPIISQPGCGKSSVTIVGFALFFLTSVDCNGDVQGVFLDEVMSGQFGSGGGYGLQAERLIE